MLLYIQVRATDILYTFHATHPTLDISISSKWLPIYLFFVLFRHLQCSTINLMFRYLIFLFGWLVPYNFTLHVLYTYRHRFDPVKVFLSVEMNTPKLVPSFWISRNSAGSPLKPAELVQEFPWYHPLWSEYQRELGLACEQTLMHERVKTSVRSEHKIAMFLFRFEVFQLFIKIHLILCLMVG